MADWKLAQRRSFEACRETCSKVNAGSDPLETALGDAQAAFSKYREAEREARNELRCALTDAYDKINDLEGELAEANKRIGKLEGELEDALSSLPSEAV